MVAPQSLELSHRWQFAAIARGADTASPAQRGIAADRADGFATRGIHAACLVGHGHVDTAERASAVVDDRMPHV